MFLRKHILSLVWYKVLPARFGGQKGIAEFNRHLSEWHDVTCLCSCDNIPGDEPYVVAPLLPTGKWQIVSPFTWFRTLSELRSRGCSHMIVEHCYHGITALMAKLFLGTQVILHEHNIEYDRFRQMGSWWWPLLWMLECMCCRISDLVLFKTEADKSMACQSFGIHERKTMVVPFGVEREKPRTNEERINARRELFSELHFQEGTKILLFTGTLDYKPNADALQGLVKEVLPMLRTMTDLPWKLLVCGRLQMPAFNYIRELSDPDYIFLGDVDQIERYLNAADVMVNPVVSGGGIKVKNIEAIAYGIPVVTTHHGAAGIDVEASEGMLFVSSEGDVQQFCRHITEVFSIVPETPAAFYLRYHWRNILASVASRL